MALILALACLFCSCSQVEDARHVVAEADSLRNAGQSLSPFTFHLSPSQSDSCAMADAAATLEPLRLIYPTAYAHANYYYGRLLREAGNHPEAMLAFLRVVQSRTKDHEIKARSWSNIANMCRLAADHEMACQILDYAAKEFLLNNDTLLYYYSLNDKAVDLAINRNFVEACELTDIIEKNCSYLQLVLKIWETRAIAYLYKGEYDSTLFCVSQLHAQGYKEASSFILKAQAYSFLGEKDSAVFYAQEALTKTNSLFDTNNAYYILANDNDQNNKEDVLKISGDRADVQKLIEIRQGELSRAVQLLEQDLSRKPNLTWLWATLATLCIIATSISIYIRKKKAKHQLISQQVDDAREEHRLLSEQNLLLEAKQEQRQSLALKQIEQYCNSIEVQNFREQLCWDDYKEMCSIINHYMFGLVNILNEAGLKKKEIQLCVLVIIGKFKGRKMASILCYAENSIRGAKEDFATKLGTTSRNLRSFLLKMATEG